MHADRPYRVAKDKFTRGWQRLVFALACLVSGDIALMSHHMQVAFNTTVVGLVIGCAGFLILQVKQCW